MNYINILHNKNKGKLRKIENIIEFLKKSISINDFTSLF
ncbi:hypothetical protein LEP1GSC112_2718 [Leptospira interrogans serovar Pomona str. UT364]|nr:hypothetical protein LEP1GSC112_2718 [Leptospira interrogans serovar Pomona str. UT364]